MLKSFKIFDINKVFFGERVVRRDGWLYDYKWKMAFKSKKYRQDFIDSIKRAREDIKEGRLYTLEELKKEINIWEN